MTQRIGKLFVTLFFALILMTSLAIVSFAGIAESWHFLGSPPSVGTVSGNNYTDVAYDSGGTPYVAFVDSANGNKATVMKYTGGTWSAVGGAGFSPSSVNEVHLAITGTTVYALYRNGSGGLTVDVYTGTTWSHVVSPTINTGNGQTASIALYGNNIYVAYADLAHGRKLSVMHFDGTNWSPLGGSLAISSKGVYFGTSIATGITGTVYAAYGTFGSIVLMEYSGGTWTTAPKPYVQGIFPSLKTDSTGTPVMAFQDSAPGTTDYATVMTYTGSAWVAVGAEGFSGGKGLSPKLAVGAGDQLFVAFADELAGNKISVMSYDSLSGNWVYVGNRGASVGDIDTTSPSIAVIPTSVTPIIGFSDNGLGGDVAVMQLGTNTAPVGGNDSASALDSTPTTFIPLENDSDADGDYLRVSAILTAPLHGTASISGYTQIVYTPTTAYVGTDSLGYVVTDGALTDTATVSITVVSVNNAPVAANDGAVADEDIPVTISPLLNDTDPDTDTLSISHVSNGRHGTATISGTTQIVYTPDTNFYGVDRFWYAASDGALTDTAIVSVTVTPVNDAPQIATTAFQPVTATKFTGAVFLKMAFDHAGTPYVAYQDSAASFAITVKKYNGSAWTLVGTPVVTLGGATYSTFTIDKEDMPFVAYRDPSNNLLTVQKYSGGNWSAVGAIARSSGGSGVVSDMTMAFNAANEPLVTYSDGGIYMDRFNGSAWVSDASYGSGFKPAMALNSAGTAYVAVRSHISSKAAVFENSSGNFTALGTLGFSHGDVVAPRMALNNDDVPYAAYIDDNSFTKTLRVMAYNGAAWAQVGADLSDNVLAADFAMTNGGIPTVVCVANASELWMKQYINNAWTTVLSDTTAGVEAVVAVNPANETHFYSGSGSAVSKVILTPVLTAAVTMDEDGSPTPFYLAPPSVWDYDSTVLTWTVAAAPAHGSAGGGASPSYTPGANYNGTDSFVAAITDGALTDSLTVTVTINPQEDPPQVIADTPVITEDVATYIDVLANDVEVDGQGLSITSVGAAAHGSTVNSAGTRVYYIPTQNYNGTDTFSYVASDGALTATTTVTVTISAVNDAPAAVDDLVYGTDTQPLTILPLENDSDIDGDALTVQSVSGALNGTANVSGTTQIVYTPTLSFNGSEFLQYIVTDGALTDTASITVNISANQPPVAVADTAATDEDIAVTISPLGNDSDPNGDPLTLSAVDTPAHGTAVISGGTQIVYTPTLNFNGDDVFTVTITDGYLTDSAAVTVTVQSINDAPTAVDDTAAADEGLAITISPLGNDSDVENDPLTISAVGTVAHGTAVISGGTQIVYTPTTAFTGTDVFSYIVTDGALADTANITVTVNPLAETRFYIYLPLVVK